MKPKPTVCKYYELEIVNDLLGKLPDNRSAVLKAHLAGCESCQRVYTQWQQILTREDVAPSPNLYQRLKKAYQIKQLKDRLRQPRFFWGIGIGLAVLLITLVTGQIKKPYLTWEQPPIVTESSMPLFVVNDTKTVPYTIPPQAGQPSQLEGMIWINKHCDEIFFCIRGLKQNSNFDYQIWLIKPVKRENGGLLQIKDQCGALHLQQRNIREVQQISISREPKGGSPYPTTADTILVDFKPHP